MYQWNTIPGSSLYLVSNTLDGGGYTGDRAVGYVTSRPTCWFWRIRRSRNHDDAALCEPPLVGFVDRELRHDHGGLGRHARNLHRRRAHGGSGSGATATIVVGVGGGVTSVMTTLANGGGGYVPNSDVLSAASGNIGGCTGFSVPVASIGQIGINRGAQIKVYNSGGCDTVRQLSETTARGYQPGEYFRFLFMGQSTQSISIGVPANWSKSTSM